MNKLTPSLLLLALGSSLGFAQGTLTPPGAPAPTMKTLSQIEPRVAVQTLAGDAATQYVITQPGSYYLTGSISVAAGQTGIAIAASSVTLDLGGHLISGVAGSLSGVEIRGARSQIAIENGHLRFFERAGILAVGASSNIRVEGVGVSDVTDGAGIALSAAGANVLVRGCTVSDVVGTGGILVSSALGLVERCVVASCSGPAGVTGISARNVIGCEVNGVSAGGGGGALGIGAQVVENCVVNSIAGTGSVQSIGILGATVTGSSASLVSSSGVGTVNGISGNVVMACQAQNITGSTGSTTGITGSEVSHCNVGSVSVASGSGACEGIAAEVITDSRVNTLSSNSSGNVIGLRGYRIARDCSITGLSSPGTGQAIGCSTTLGGRTESIVIGAGVDIGVSVTTAQTVTGCSISSGIAGILVTGIRNVVDGNNLIGPSTTGISVTSGSNTAHALVIRNQVRNCTVNIQADTPAQVGPVVSAQGLIATTASPFSNFTD